jgi:hypothetical protein
LAERWNGTKWSIQNTPNPRGSTQIGLQGVSCTSASACTAVGAYFNGIARLPLVERWNGTKWSIQRASNPTASTYGELNAVACTSQNACTAVGDYNNNAGYVTLAERWNGTRWFIQDTPNPTGSRQTILYGIGCTSGSACTAVGERAPRKLRTLAERWNGTKWSIQSTPYPRGSSGGDTLYGIACTSSSSCIAAGGYGDTTNLARTLAERWNGR